MNKDEIDVEKYPFLSPNDHGWDRFVLYAKKGGIGDDIADWWVCWCMGYNTAMNLM